MKIKFVMAACLVSALMLCARAGFVDGTAAFVPGGSLSNGNDCAALVDFNNDGYVDFNNYRFLYRNEGGTHYTYVGSSGAGYVWADYNNDGLLDRYLWTGGGYLQRLNNTAGTDVSTYYNNAVMPLLPSVTYEGTTYANQSQAACWGDWNKDGFADLYVTGYERSSDSLWAFPDVILMNNGGTSFTMTHVPGTDDNRARGVTACDFDRDGDQDIFVSCYRLRENNLWLNDGSGHFTDVATARGVAGDGTTYNDRGHTIGSCWGDFNNDGFFDLFIANFAHPDVSQDRPMMMQNMGPSEGYSFVNRWTLDGTQYQESYATAMAADYDNDGDLDLFFTTVYAVGSGGAIDNSRLWRNNGNWNFTDVTTTEGLPSDLGETYGAAWGDVNNDGFPDLLTNDKLFINQGNANKWLKVRLLGNGTTVNRAAIGAQVRIALGDKTLVRQVEGGSGKGSQNELTLHFGLGARTTPVDLTITWPDGTMQTVEDVALNQTLTVTAPAALGVSVQSLAPVVGRGADAAAQSFTVRSDSLQPMAFAVSDDADWLSLAPASGTCLEGAAESVQVTYATGALTSGTYHATITVTSADVTNSPQTVAVTLTVVPQVGDLPIIEPFEGYAAGTLLNGVNGWIGDPSVNIEARACVAATPPGFPLPGEAHTQVLRGGDEIAREVNGTTGQNVSIDFMLKVNSFEGSLPTPEADGQLYFCADSNRLLNVWHTYPSGAGRAQRWSDLGMPAVADGEWVRISVSMDYASNPYDTFFQPRVNGSLCPSPHAFKSPTDLTSPGTWYLCANSPGQGGSGSKQLSGVAVSGVSALDDLVITADQPFAHTGTTSTNGVPFAWFDRWGVARIPETDYDGDGFSAAAEYAAGTDPSESGSSFRIIDAWTENNRFFLRFLGNDSGESAPYIVERSSNGRSADWTVADPAVPRAAAPTTVNIWSEPLSPNGPFLYRLRTAQPGY